MLRCIWVSLIFAILTTCGICDEGFQTWTDSSGKFEIEAKLIRIRDRKVVRRSKDTQWMALRSSC